MYRYMPFEVRQEGKKWRLFNLHKKEYTKSNFKSKETAISTAKNYMRYRHETPVVKGNKILSK